MDTHGVDSILSDRNDVYTLYITNRFLYLDVKALPVRAPAEEWDVRRVRLTPTERDWRDLGSID